ncbi:MAG: DUF1624 domain-containing protein [Pseudomonadales bacterium]|nr:DUF1624 domain-containing protein [Pseudomonadales bacterium]
MSSSLHPRYPLIDYLRFTAIVLMVIYHINFDLYFLKVISREAAYHPFLIVIARTCLCLFIFCVGYSLALNKRKYEDYADFIRGFFKNWLKVFLAALLVSVATYIAVGKLWVYFGILHCITVSLLLCLPLLFVPRLTLLMGVVMMTVYAGWDLSLPWFSLHRATIDYIPVFPWIGMAFIGIGCESFALHKKIQLPQNRWVLLVSRHSLLIYLMHQPIIAGTIWILKQLGL